MRRHNFQSTIAAMKWNCGNRWMFATEQKEEKGKIEVKNAREFVRHKTCSNILFDFVGSYIFFFSFIVSFNCIVSFLFILAFRIVYGCCCLLLFQSFSLFFVINSVALCICLAIALVLFASQHSVFCIHSRIAVEWIV